MKNRFFILLSLIRSILKWGPQGICKSTFQFITWMISYFVWSMHIRFDATLKEDDLPKLTVILLSYNRPQNMQMIVRSFLKCRFVTEIILSNNNPDVDIHKYVKSKDKRLTIIQQKIKKACVERFSIARTTSAKYFIAVDDDLYFYPADILKLFKSLINEPKRVHGVTGWTLKQNKETKSSYIDRFRYERKEVDVINRAYAFTDDHVHSFFNVLENLKKNAPDLINYDSPEDDIILSYSGEEKTVIEAIGPYIPCPSGMVAAIACFGAK